MRAEDRGTLTVDDVYQMVDAGKLDADAHVELLDGKLLPMSPQGGPHVNTIARLRDTLAAAFGEGYVVHDHSPLPVGGRNLPEPDIAVLRGTHDDYDDRLGTAADVVLIVEVAQTSQARDRRKAAIYARGGIPTYWIVDLKARTLTVQRDPSRRGYRDRKVFREDDQLAAPAGGGSWRVRDFLPRGEVARTLLG